jgi:tetratricopeptide (TPR) repeat protein
MAQPGEGLPDRGKNEPLKTNPSVLIEAKKMYYSGKDHDAESLLGKYVDRYPEDPVGYYELSKLQASRKAYPEALTNAEKAYRLQPENNWYLLYLAEIYQMNQEYEKALVLPGSLL